MATLIKLTQVRLYGDEFVYNTVVINMDNVIKFWPVYNDNSRTHMKFINDELIVRESVDQIMEMLEYGTAVPEEDDNTLYTYPNHLYTRAFRDMKRKELKDKMKAMDTEDKWEKLQRIYDGEEPTEEMNNTNEEMQRTGES